MNEMVSLLVLALSWLVYFVIHSVLASLSFKGWIGIHFAWLMPWYRLLYNVLAVVLLLPPLFLMYRFSGDALWQWQGAMFVVSNVLALLALSGFIWTLRYYDGMDFLGLRQATSTDTSADDKASFCLSPLHRVVRHPWYFLALVIIWTRDMDAAFLLSAVCMSLYFIVGSVFEERKLLRFHGEVYARYRQWVPSLVPLPWRYLDKQGMQEINSLISGNKKL